MPILHYFDESPILGIPHSLKAIFAENTAEIDDSDVTALTKSPLTRVTREVATVNPGQKGLWTKRP